MPQRTAPPAGRKTRSTEPALVQVHGKTLRELAYEELRRAVIAGQFAPGEAVTIADIASRLKIGVMPAREAVQQLASQGAFEFLANRSVRVPQIGREGLDDLFDARFLVETDLVRRAALRSATLDGTSLSNALADLERRSAARDMQASLATNHAFHFAIYAASGAPTLTGLADVLWLRMSPLHVAVFRSGAERQSAFLSALPSHRELVAALAAGDAAAATTVFRHMLSKSRDWHRENFASGG